MQEIRSEVERRIIDEFARRRLKGENPCIECHGMGVTQEEVMCPHCLGQRVELSIPEFQAVALMVRQPWYEDDFILDQQEFD